MATAKWLSSQALAINLNAEQPVAMPRRYDDLVRLGGKVTISRLTDGTQAGRTVVVLQLDLDDGSTVCLELTLRTLAAAVDAFRARDQAEGRPA